MVKQRLRPQRSLSLLQGIMRIAMINRNRVIAAWTPCTVVSRSSVMSLIITFMFEPAKLQMNCASASGARKLRREIAALPAAGASGIPPTSDRRRTAATGHGVKCPRLGGVPQAGVHGYEMGCA